MAKLHVKKGDTVIVLTGENKNKKGKVLAVDAKKSRLLVEGVNKVTRHTKPRSQGQQGGIVKQEAPIHSSNVMYFCGKCDRPSRIGKQVLDNGTKLRICKNCGSEIDTIIEKD